MRRTLALSLATLLAIAGLSVSASAAPTAPTGTGDGPSAAAQRVFDFWTPERIAQATPRDLVVDARGRGYLRALDGTLTPYGKTPTPTAAPGPSITDMVPAASATVQPTSTFSATVTDADGVRSVRFSLRRSGTTKTQSVTPTASGSTWSAVVSNLAAGTWSWWVTATDTTRNTTTSSTLTFTVSGTPATVADATWTGGGAVQSAAGRILFQMGSSYYVCSGTVATDTVSGQSLIVTAAHCVYDDAGKAFATNVLFIPNQSGTTGTGTDWNCGNDPIGCWAPTYGVVDVNWTTRVFPDNIPWDYGFYVVPTSGRHTAGLTAADDSLEIAAGSLAVSFAAPANAYSWALGYSYSRDPLFRYCGETLGTNGSANWWLGSCTLSGGSSGGPWMQTDGSGPIFSVNSWGYTRGSGMAGPKFNGTSAQCVYQTANTSRSTPASGGVAPSC